MKKNINLKDVASKAGVGIGTASRVLNNQANVSDEKREKVLKAIEDLNYRPNEIARSLKTKITRTIGVIVMDITNPFFTSVVQGIENCLNKFNYSIILVNLNWDSSRFGDRVQELADKNVDGIIYMGLSVDNEDMSSIDKLSMPITFLSTNILINDTKFNGKYCSISIDNEKAGYDATKLLLDKGHQKIAYIAGMVDDFNSSVPRGKGYLKALKEHRIEPNKNWMKYGSYTLKSGYNAMLEILDSDEMPSAVFAVCDQMAMGAIKAITDRGYNVPDDISVIGFDGIESGKYFIPSVTSVYQPRYEMGNMGAEMLISLIEDKEIENYKRIMQYKIIEGESTAKTLKR